jgi:two-component system response regulator
MTDSTILLVEDNPNDIELTLIALRKWHIANDIVVVRDGIEALDYLCATGTYANRDPAMLPQLVLLDLRLPKVSGLEVLQQLRARERTQDLPVIVFTSSADEWDRLQSYHLGVLSYVTKPLDVAEFIAAVRQLGLFWCLVSPVPTGGASA